MKVTLIASCWVDGTLHPEGTVVDVSEATQRTLVQMGRGVAVVEEPEEERRPAGRRSSRGSAKAPAAPAAPPKPSEGEGEGGAPPKPPEGGTLTLDPDPNTSTAGDKTPEAPAD